MTLPLAVTQLSPQRRYQCILVCIFPTSVLLTLFRYYMDGLSERLIANHAQCRLHLQFIKINTEALVIASKEIGLKTTLTNQNSIHE